MAFSSRIDLLLGSCAGEDLLDVGGITDCPIEEAVKPFLAPWQLETHQNNVCQ